MEDEKTVVGGKALSIKPKRVRRRSWRRELKERVFGHWPSTITGLALATAEIFGGMFDKFLETGDILAITSMSGPELKSRLIKAALIAGIGAFGRFGGMYRYRQGAQPHGEA